MRRPDCSATSVTSWSRRKHARSATRAGVPGRAHEVLAGAAPRRRRPTSSVERLGERGGVEPGLGREPDLVGDRVPRQLGGRAERGELAARDDRDAVAQLLGFVHRVRREQARSRRGRAGRGRAARWSPGRAGPCPRSARRGTRRRAGRSARTRATAAAPARPRAGAPACATVSRSPTASSSSLGVDAGRRSTRRRGAAARAASGPDRGRLLAASRRCAAAARPPSRTGSSPSTRDAARVGRAVALEDLDRRRLARAVRAEQAEHLARRDVEGQAVDRDGRRRSASRVRRR